jgi:hypothetical protein
MAILAKSATAAHMASSSYGSYDKVELREMEDKVNVIKSATINGLKNTEQQFELTDNRHVKTLQALHEVLLNYDTNFIRGKMDEGNIDITVYVSVPLTGPDAVMQVYMFTGMPFPVKPGFFVHIESEFQ